MTHATCPDDCSTVGVDAQSLERYEDVEAENGDLIVYDDEDQEAWIQSDVFYPRFSCV